MISENMPYRMGSRALIYMILSKMKYPFIFAIVLIAFAFVLSSGKTTLLSWQISHSFLNIIPGILFAIEKYGWLLTVLLAITLGLTAIPEYMGLMVILGDVALRVRTGLISHREITIPYRQIQTINITDDSISRMFSLCSFLVVTSANGDENNKSTDSEATLPLIHSSLARELQDEVLKRSAIK